MKNFSFAWPGPSLISSNSALMLVITETPAITVSIFLQVMAWIGLRKPQVNTVQRKIYAGCKFRGFRKF